jgi:hypothetical protein
MELAHDCPGGAAIQIYQCRRCGDLRSCRRRWHTRCHVCLDERSNDQQLNQNSQDCLAVFSANPILGLRVGRNLNLDHGQQITGRAIVQATATLTVATALARLSRPGWTVIATDVWGLPWNGVRSRPLSHGTWGQHDDCGTITLLRTGTVDCPACGPQPGSRTHRARQNDPYLLYQVTSKGLTKFGIGTEDRVRTHQRAGATVVQVLRSTFAEVVLAERKLKTSHADDILIRKTRRMPATFGAGTEVLPREHTVTLTDALPGAEDITHLF